MTTVVNTPGNNSDSSGAGPIVAILIAVVLVGIFFVYILPAIRGGNAAPQNSAIDVNLKLPANPNPAPSNPAPAPSNP